MIKAIIISLLLFLTFFLNNEIKAQDCNGSVEERISCYTENISKLQASGKTLSSQIAQFDAQIKLTSLKIAQIEEQINLLSGRIDQLEGSLTDLTKSFNQRVVETYKMTRVEDPLLLILSSKMQAVRNCILLNLLKTSLVLD
jgi:peptidoglycan hydrolase CwlO-like protein